MKQNGINALARRNARYRRQTLESVQALAASTLGGAGDKHGSPANLTTRANTRTGAAASKVRWPVFLFLLTLFVPWAIFLGPLRMSLYRLLLAAIVIPCFLVWRSGKAGQWRLADVAMLLYWLWSSLSLVVNHGMRTSLEPVGIGFIETMGPYLLARCYIRDADEFFGVVKLLFRIVVVVMPFAIVEFITGDNVWRDMFAAIWPVREYGQMPPRSGLFRVQTAFDHPIQFGVCVGSILALVHLVLGYQKTFFQRWLRAGTVVFVSGMSLSAGPLIGVFVQGALLVWNGLLHRVKNRWQILTGISVSLALLVQLVANRSLLNIFVNFFVFESGSYWYRLYIWEYGSLSVANHPFLGIGLNDWERPPWMGESIDNLWLVLAVRHGLPASIFLFLAMLAIFLGLASKKGLDDRTSAYRTAFLISIASFFLVGWTVHYWDAALVFLFFLMGSGVWMLDLKEQVASESNTNPRPERPISPRSPVRY